MLDKPTKTELNVQYMLFLISAMSELEVYLINESPRVTASSIEAEFVVNGPVTGVRCFLRSQVDRLWQDCETAFLCPAMHMHPVFPLNLSSLSSFFPLFRKSNRTIVLQARLSQGSLGCKTYKDYTCLQAHSEVHVVLHYVISHKCTSLYTFYVCRFIPYV